MVSFYISLDIHSLLLEVSIQYKISALIIAIVLQIFFHYSIPIAILLFIWLFQSIPDWQVSSILPNTFALVACWCRQVMAQAVTLRATAVFVLMQSGIVNGYQLPCDGHTVHELQLFLFYSLSFFSTFSFYVFVTLDSPFLGGLYSLC